MCCWLHSWNELRFVWSSFNSMFNFHENLALSLTFWYLWENLPNVIIGVLGRPSASYVSFLSNPFPPDLIANAWDFILQVLLQLIWKCRHSWEDSVTHTLLWMRHRGWTLIKRQRLRTRELWRRVQLLIAVVMVQVLNAVWSATRQLCSHGVTSGMPGWLN